MTKSSKFLIKAKDTYKFHRAKLLLSDDWTIARTATALRRSLGSVSEDLLIIKWYKTHEDKIDKFDYQHEALEWIRRKQKEQDTDEIS